MASARTLACGAVAVSGVIALSGIRDAGLAFSAPRTALEVTRSPASDSVGFEAVELPSQPRLASEAPSSTLCVGGLAGVLAASALVGARHRASKSGRALAVRCRASAGELAVGSKVQWNGKEGTVSYVGPTKFAAGEWVGIALETDAGMHDGTVMGVSYFECAPKRGVFAQAAQLTAQGAAPAPQAPPASPPPVVATSAPAAPATALAVGTKVGWNGKVGTVSFVGATSFAAGEWVGVTLDTDGGMHDGSVLGARYFECAPRRGIFAKASQLAVAGGAPVASAPQSAAPAAAQAAAAPVAAAVGAEVSVGSKVRWNGKEGTVRFVGSAKFASGEWVGVELNAPEGMHDGAVMGVSYFSCAPKCGIFTQAAQLQVLELVAA